MEDKLKELNYLKAKEELSALINSFPSRYGLTFILIDEMIKDIQRQTAIASINDRRGLEKFLVELNEDIK